MANMYSDPSSSSDNPFLSSSNPYLQGSIDKAQGDLTRQYNLTTQPAYNSAMVKSGSFGNEGVNQMNQNAQKNLMNAQGNIDTSMRNADYQQRGNMYMQQQQLDNSNYWNNNNFNRSLYNDAYSQNMNNLTTGVGLLGTLSGYNANDLTNANTIQNTPMNYWSQFANQANGFGQGYGTQTGTVGSTSSPVMSALGGAQLGQSAMGWWNRQNSQNQATASNTPAGSAGFGTGAAYGNQDMGQYL